MAEIYMLFLKKKFQTIFFVLIFGSCSVSNPEIVFEDGFERMQRGPISTDKGADTEYHYLTDAKPHGAWAVATFRTGVFPLAWSLREDSIGRYIHHKYS